MVHHVDLVQTKQFTGAISAFNHVYVFEKKPEGRSARAIAYVPRGSKTLQRFSRPYEIDLRGRTFVELDNEEPEEPPGPDEWKVEGSNGRTYTISREPGGGLDYRCTCPGFTYRGSCRHVAEMQQSHGYDIR